MVLLGHLGNGNSGPAHVLSLDFGRDGLSALKEGISTESNHDDKLVPYLFFFKGGRSQQLDPMGRKPKGINGDHLNLKGDEV